MELAPNDFKRMLPLPVTVITTKDLEGVANAAPYGCVMPILGPLDLIAIASALPRQTLANIRNTGQFVVNVMGMPSFEKAMRTARNYPPEVDELEAEGVETIPSKSVEPPRIKDALGWIEAITEKEIAEDNYVLTVGKVVCAELNESFSKDGQLTEPPMIMLNPHYRLTGERKGDVNETRKLFADDSNLRTKHLE